MDDGRYRLMTNEEWASRPVWRSQEKLSNDAVAVMRFTHPETGWSWYVLEREDDTDLLFGYVAGFEFELGSFSLSELEENFCVRDYDFEPTTVRVIKQVHGVQVIEDIVVESEPEPVVEIAAVVEEVQPDPEPEVIVEKPAVEPEPEPAPFIVDDIEDFIGFVWPHDYSLEPLVSMTLEDAGSRQDLLALLSEVYN